MHYGAISTDIKKSSSNWGSFPKWMEQAVMLTNNITEYVFKKNPIEGEDASQIILPNSPEGDAYTLFYTHHSKNDLESHMTSIALKIQYLLKLSREAPADVQFNGFGMSSDSIKNKIKDMIKNEKDAVNTSHEKVHSLIDMYKNIDKKYDYIGRIYLRIGIAHTNTPPFEYTYNGKKSFRGGVIDLSEKAEQEAPYKKGYGLYNIDTKKVDKREEEKDYADLKDVSVWEELVKKTQTSRATTGFMIFIHYHFGITEEMVNKNPHLIVQLNEEFKSLHDETNKLLSAIDGVRLVKVKRDSSSMYYVADSNTAMSRTRKKVKLFTVCSNIISLLPKGSSVGICYSGIDRLNEVQRGTKKIIDYFGPAVNMAARMEFIDWSYPTTNGITLKDSHDSRIAFGDWDDLKDMYVPRNNISRDNSKGTLVQYPFRVDKIPAETLNAGYGEYVYVLSKKLHGRNELKIGDRIKWSYANKQYPGTITKIDIFNAKVRIDLNKREYDTKIRHLKKIHGEDAKEEASEFLEKHTETSLYKFKF